MNRNDAQDEDVQVPGDGLGPVELFAREDESQDEYFYEYARKLVHIDDEAIRAASLLYGELLPPTGRILDFMSSWRSHLPLEYRPEEVVGLGMNADEMADNPQLTSFLVRDVNREPSLPFRDDHFGGAICTVSIQYLVHPLRIFQEVRRALRPGSPFILTFSNRCFPTKAIALWRGTNDAQHVEIVRKYFQASATWENVQSADRSPGPLSDPLYAVWGYKTS